MSEINTEFMLLKTADFYTWERQIKELVSVKYQGDGIKKKAIKKKLLVLFRCQFFSLRT